MITALLISLNSYSQCENVNLELHVDKFTGDSTYDTPTYDGISFTRVKSKGIVTTYMYIRNPGSTVNVYKTGVTILCDSSKKIVFPDEKVDCDVSGDGDGYTYSSFIRLTPKHIALLKRYNITDTELYIYQHAVQYPNPIREMLICVMKKF